jgi:hypothetical protein
MVKVTRLKNYRFGSIGRKLRSTPLANGRLIFGPAND